MIDIAALSKQQKPVLLIAGATAVGKSRFALDAAEQTPSVIINADSMQVYDAIPILTAQPSAEERSQAAHVLYGTLDPRDLCSAARWAALAKRCIDDAWVHKKLPIVIGGTGLYLRTLLDGISAIPKIDPAVRVSVRALFEAKGSLAVKAALVPLDPVIAQRLADNDSQRLCRALEVVRSTGIPLSEWQKQPLQGGLATKRDLSIEKYVLNVERQLLYRRCDMRLEHMLGNGALDELQQLVDLTLPLDTPIMRAVGVPPLTRYILGNTSKIAAVECARRDTRRFAKRQLTWLRNQFGKWNWLCL